MRRTWNNPCSGCWGFRVSTSRLRLAVPFLAVSVLAAGEPAPQAATPVTLAQYDPIFARFNSTTPPAYRSFRRLEAGNDEGSRHGWMEVWTEYRPGVGMTFEVVREEGSAYVRNKALRGLLETEQELLETGKPLRAPLLPRNYRIEEGGVTEHGLVRLLLHPARRAEGIVRGTALVDPAQGNVPRIEGRLVKSPSFWVRDVDVIWKFARIGDAILIVELTSSARVRLFGRHHFSMTYDYHMVDGRVLDDAERAALRDNQ